MRPRGARLQEQSHVGMSLPGRASDWPVLGTDQECGIISIGSRVHQGEVLCWTLDVLLDPRIACIWF